MIKKATIAAGTMGVSLFTIATMTFAQTTTPTATPSPTTTVTPTTSVTPSPTRTVPSGAPRTGRGY